MSIQLKNRFKSFAWRAGMMLAALAVSFVLDNMELLHITGEIQVVLGLVLGEVSKYLNRNA